MSIKKNFDPNVTYRPGRLMRNQHIFKSALIYEFELNGTFCGKFNS